MLTRGGKPCAGEQTYILCCGEQVFSVPVGKDLMYRGGDKARVTKTSVECPHCNRTILLELADEAVAWGQ